MVKILTTICEPHAITMSFINSAHVEKSIQSNGEYIQRNVWEWKNCNNKDPI